MATCQRCGGTKRRWARACPPCRTKWDRRESAGAVADVAVAAGLFGWIRRGVTALFQWVLRAFN